MIKINKKNKYYFFIFIIVIVIIFILYYLYIKYLLIELFNNNDTNIIKQEAAVVLSHNMLGDNITNISVVNFLSNYYNTIYFICKDVYVENLNLLFKNKIINKNLVLVPFNSNNENENCKNIISEYMKNDLIDIFVSGHVHTPHLKSRITHPKLLTYVKNDNGYTIKWIHIHDFYHNIGLDLSIYYNYFQIDSSKESIEYYENIKNYKIIFLHTKSSEQELSLKNIIEKYINYPNTIIICANKNVYENTHINYELANKYVNLLVPYYIDIIYNAFEIHVVDSCFSCIIHPLNITKKLKAHSVNIYDRTDLV